MRCGITHIVALTVTALVVANSTTTFAGTASGSTATRRHHHESAPSFYDCYKLAWVRGVHVERDELGAFNEYCLTNQVPFDSGFAAGSVHRDSN